VLAEFYWVATRRLARPLADADAATVVDTLAELTVVGADAELVRSAISLARRQQISSWDALIIRAAQVAGCDRLLTEDLQHDARFDDVRVENPFAQIAR
jgi:predicted nucleic acid-binding protein